MTSINVVHRKRAREKTKDEEKRKRERGREKEGGKRESDDPKRENRKINVGSGVCRPNRPSVTPPHC